MNRNLFDVFLVRLQKMSLALKENVEIEDFINVNIKNIQLITEPFPHIVVDDFFKPEIYEALSNQFTEVKNLGLSEEKQADYGKFHAFNMDYDGYLYIPSPTLDAANPRRLFYSLEWNNFFSKIFSQSTSFETSVAFHHHPAGDQTGFVHHDFSDKSFPKKSFLPNGVIATEIGDTQGNRRRRVISLLIYLNNPPWHEGGGGETGIYSKDGKTLLKKVPPVNNRLFAFQTSPLSMHAFQANKSERNCIVQWFHLPPESL